MQQQHPPFTVEARVGRLVEARVYGLRTRDEADAYTNALAECVARVPMARRPILCADHRPVVIYPQPVADRLVELFMSMNARIERVAILGARTNATLVLQLERLVREAAYAERRVLYTPIEAERHLQPALDAAEIARLRAFLGEYDPISRAAPRSR